MADLPDDEPETFVQKAVKVGLIAIPLMMYISWAHKKIVPCPRVKCPQERSSYVKKWLAKSKRVNKKNKCEDSKQDRRKEKYKDVCQHQVEDICKTRTKSKAKSPQSNKDTESISPDVIDTLFEQHFQKCIDEFKHHKKRMKQELLRMQEDCKDDENPEASDRNYLACLAKYNMDKDFECDPNFHSTDTNTPYVVKNYNCKAITESKSKEETDNSYLQCLNDLNLDKQIEEKQETECHETTNIHSSTDKQPDEKEIHEDRETNIKKTAHGTKTKHNTEDDGRDRQMKELCENLSPEDNPEYDYTAKAKLDDCGCDPHANTKSTSKYGRTKGDPDSPVKTNDTEDDALSDFWHACGPPKGLRKGCQADECKDSPERK